MASSYLVLIVTVCLLYCGATHAGIFSDVGQEPFNGNSGLGGQDACPIGSNPLTEDECKQLVDKPGNTFVGTVNEDFSPSGCFNIRGGPDFYYNTHATGAYDSAKTVWCRHQKCGAYPVNGFNVNHITTANGRSFTVTGLKHWTEADDSGAPAFVFIETDRDVCSVYLHRSDGEQATLRIDLYLNAVRIPAGSSISGGAKEDLLLTSIASANEGATEDVDYEELPSTNWDSNGLALFGGPAQVGNVAWRCIFRFTTLADAKIACTWNKQCAAITRDNGLFCPSGLKMYELRTAATEGHSLAGFVSWRRVDNRPFFMVFMSDLEHHYRGLTTDGAKKVVEEIATLAKHNLKFDTVNPGTGLPYPIGTPAIVVHGGDINGDGWGCNGFATFLSGDCKFQDSFFSWYGTNPVMEFENVWKPLYSRGIPMVSAFGNHDWNTNDKSNLFTRTFVLQSYERARAVDPFLRFTKFDPEYVGPGEASPLIMAEYRGVQIANFMNDPFQGAVQKPDYNSPDSGFEAADRTRPSVALDQFQAAVDSLDRNKPTIFVQHKPILKLRSETLYLAPTTEICPFKADLSQCIEMAKAWSETLTQITTRVITETDPDYPPGCYFYSPNNAFYYNYHAVGRTRSNSVPWCATGTKDKYLDTIEEFAIKTVFSGHIHESRTYYHRSDVTEYAANYGRQGFYAVLVSPKEGVLEVKDLAFQVTNPCTPETPCTSSRKMTIDGITCVSCFEAAIGSGFGSGSGFGGIDDKTTFPSVPPTVYSEINATEASETTTNSLSLSETVTLSAEEHDDNDIQYEYKETLSEFRRFDHVLEPLFIVYGEPYSPQSAWERCRKTCSALDKCVGITQFVLHGVDGRFQCNGVDHFGSEEGEDSTGTPVINYRKIGAANVNSAEVVGISAGSAAASGGGAGIGLIVGLVSGGAVVLLLVGVIIFKRNRRNTAAQQLQATVGLADVTDV